MTTQRFTTTNLSTTGHTRVNVSAVSGGGASVFVKEKYGDISEDEDAAATLAASARQRSRTFQKVREK